MGDKMTTGGIDAPFLQAADKTLSVSRPLVMGILNITPDSFSDGGQLHDGRQPRLDQILKRAESMLLDGADILDIGGESTRPGATPVGSQQEIDRVMPVLEHLGQHTDACFSIDTSNPALMRLAIEAGAHIINDVRALRREGAVEAVVDSSAAVCLMHMRGEPGTMQDDTRYDSVEAAGYGFLKQQSEMLIAAGVDRCRIVLDPGFGFGKSPQQNMRLLARMPKLLELGFPVLAGLSRKSVIAAVTGRDIHERLPGSIALATMAMEAGAKLLRVHDVAATVDAVRLFEAMQREK